MSWFQTQRDFGARPHDAWRLTYSPGYWGSPDPSVLVLGFSKGPNQMKRGLAFDDIAFSGGRGNLTKILRALELLRPDERVEDRLHCGERDFGFASLIRCGIGMWDEKGAEYRSSGGNILVKAVTSPEAEAVVRNCTQQAFGSLSNRLRLVVMLGNTAEYVDQCYRRIRAIHPDVSMLSGNPMAYGNNRVRWVHAIHFKALGNHIPRWLGEDFGGGRASSTSREHAINAIRDLDLRLE